MSGISQQNSRHQKRTAHGVSFQRGPLFALLSNRIYLGETAHKGTAYPGDHEALIDRELWDKVQALIARAISAVRPVMRTRGHLASPSREAIRARRSFSKRSFSAYPASWASSYPAPIHRGGVGLQCWQGIGRGHGFGLPAPAGWRQFPGPSLSHNPAAVAWPARSFVRREIFQSVRGLPVLVRIADCSSSGTRRWE